MDFNKATTILQSIETAVQEDSILSDLKQDLITSAVRYARMKQASKEAEPTTPS